MGCPLPAALHLEQVYLEVERSPFQLYRRSTAQRVSGELLSGDGGGEGAKEEGLSPDCFSYQNGDVVLAASLHTQTHPSTSEGRLEVSGPTEVCGVGRGFRESLTV